MRFISALSRQGQADGKNRAFRLAIAQGNLAAMAVHDLADNGQAQPRPGFPGCKKRLEYFFPDTFWYAVAVVNDLQDNGGCECFLVPGCGFLGPEQYPSLFHIPAGIGAVCDQIEKHLPDQLWITPAVKTGRDLQVNGQGGVPALVLAQGFHGLPRQSPQGKPFLFRVDRLGEEEKFMDCCIKPV